MEHGPERGVDLLDHGVVGGGAKVLLVALHAGEVELLPGGGAVVVDALVDRLIVELAFFVIGRGHLVGVVVAEVLVRGHEGMVRLKDVDRHQPRVVLGLSGA